MEKMSNDSCYNGELSVRYGIDAGKNLINEDHQASYDKVDGS
ncbi:hypothetical protein [Anaeromicrobium sediminis]|nr:hypothetical protein [Anaeromicrobium sediminis]